MKRPSWVMSVLGLLSDGVKKGNYEANSLNSDDIASLRTEIVEQLCCTLFSIGVFAERIDNPHLTEVDSSSKSSGFRVSRDELDVLDTTSLNAQISMDVETRRA